MSRLLAGWRALPLIAGVVAIACFAGGVSTASATVQVDPDGPAGHQYELPLDSVRGDNAGNPSLGVPGSTAETPLFGQGLGPASKDGHANELEGDGPSFGGAGGPLGAGADIPADVKSDPTVAELINGTGGGTSTTLDMILLIGGMALVGLTAGLIGRRTL